MIPIEPNMHDLLLSVIVPLYNGEMYIENLIHDIHRLNGKAYPFEVILVDDGSKDNTLEICNELSVAHSEIKIIHKENGGIASARNAGLELASGKYVTFADQDDTYLNGYKEFLDQCIDEDLDILITSPYNKKINEEKLNQRIFADQTFDDEKQIKKIAGKLIDGNYLSDSSAPFVSTSVWNVLYRRELLVDNNIHFKVFIDYEDDWIFNIETLIHAKKIATTSKGYYCWNIRSGSESHRSKYIPDLLTKRKNWMSWLSGIMKDMDIKPEIADSFIKEVLIPRNIMMCFNNACWNEDISKNDRLQEIREAILPNGWNIENVDINSVKEMSKSNEFLLKLLKANCLGLAYTLNCTVLKNRFH